MAASSLRLCRSESGEDAPTSVLPVVNDQQTRSNISLTNLAIHLCVDKRFSDLAVFNAPFYIQVRRVDEPS
jgi:hypothetical protein